MKQTGVVDDTRRTEPLRRSRATTNDGVNETELRRGNLSKMLAEMIVGCRPVAETCVRGIKNVRVSVLLRPVKAFVILLIATGSAFADAPAPQPPSTIAPIVTWSWDYGGGTACYQGTVTRSTALEVCTDSRVINYWGCAEKAYTHSGWYWGGPSGTPHPGDQQGLAQCMAMATDSAGQTTGPWGYGVVIFSISCPAGYTYVAGPSQYCQLSQEFYVADDPPPKSVSDSNPTACVGDPINPTTGAVIKSEGDCMASSPSQPSFSRIYSSSNSSSTNLGTGWRGSFSRRIDVYSVIAARRTYIANSPDNSTLYSSASAACTSGFAQIQSRVPTWAGAIAVYEENLCKIEKNSVVMGILPVYTNGAFSMSVATPVGYEVTRDDGQVIRFTMQSGVITAPPTITLQLQTTANGYTLADASNNVEAYDNTGVLQTITSRSGGVQSMFYDVSGRLSTVTDSFGHKLILGYDAQNRVISVTRQ